MKTYIIRLVKKLRYLYKFGIVSGTRILLQLSLGKDLVQLHLPGYAHPIYVRKTNSDLTTFEDVFVREDYDVSFATKYYGMQLIDMPPRFIVDGGANIGYSAVYFAKQYPTAHIIAVEPDSANVEMINRNIQGYANITLVCAALWNKNGYIAIDNPEDESRALRVREAETPSDNTIPTLTLTDLMATHQADTIDILKLNVEGSEKVIFESNYASWLDKTRLLMVALHDPVQDGCSVSFYRAMVGYDFKQLFRSEHVVIKKEIR